MSHDSQGSALLEHLRQWEDLLTLIVDPHSERLRDREASQRLLGSLLQRAGIATEEFWKMSPGRRGRTFLGRYSHVSRGVEALEVSRFDLDRAVKERFRTEPLTVGAAWGHGFWRSYFSQAAITHPANDGLREEFSTTWEVMRRRAVLLPRHGESAEQPVASFDLPILVGPLPHSDGITLERAYIEAMKAAAGPERRIGTRVVLSSEAYRQQADYYATRQEHILVRMPVAELLIKADGSPGSGWSLVDELDRGARMLEVQVPETMQGPELHAVLQRLHRRHPALLLSVFLRHGAELWKQLLHVVRADGVAMVHLHAGSEKSYRLVPAVDAFLKRARLRSRVSLVSAGGDTDTIASAAAAFEAILLGANAASITHMAEVALAPDFADVLRGAPVEPVLEQVRQRPAEENADWAASTLHCWQQSILDFLSCMGIDAVQKTSGNPMAITMTADWLRQVDALGSVEFGRWNQKYNHERLADEPIPASRRRDLCVSRLLGRVTPDLEMVAAAKVLAQRNASYHLYNTNENLTAEHLEVIYRMAAGRFPEVEDFFVEGAPGPGSLDGIAVQVSRQSVQASLEALRRDASALDYINLCVPRGMLRPGAVPAGATCRLSRDPQGNGELLRFAADACGGFAVDLPEAPPAVSAMYLLAQSDEETAPQVTKLRRVTPAGEGEETKSAAPDGLSVRYASADQRVLLREQPRGWVLEGAAVREPLYTGPVHHASISLGAASEDLLVARIEANEGLSLTSSGEGGPIRLSPRAMRWESLQAASAHFGITAADLRQVRDVEIKINQGAKPGKGGRLAGAKVTATVSRARNIPIGTDALSPDPKHDIYSIEDMPAEVWLWLHYGVHCGIKITGSNYTRYVAAGMWSNFVVDYLLVDAGLAGSGNYHADSSRVGWPDLFRTILHTHHALLQEPLRDEATGRTWPLRDRNGRAFGAQGGTKLLASGGLRSEMDMLKVLLAGADGLLEASIGKAVAFGCNQCGNCHLDCPRGGITTKTELTVQNDRESMRQRFLNWSALNMVKLAVLMDAINREKGWVGKDGRILRSEEALDDVRKLRGRTDLLIMPHHGNPPAPIEVPDAESLEQVVPQTESAGPERAGHADVSEAADGGAGMPVGLPLRSRDDNGSSRPQEPPRAPEVERDSCRVGSLVTSEAVDVDAIWEAARVSYNGGNNRGGGIAFAGFVPPPLRLRTCLVFNTLGPDRQETMQRILEHCEGLLFFDAQGQEMSHDEVRLRLKEFRVPRRPEHGGDDGWRRAGLREDPGDMTFLFTELRSDALWRYAQTLLQSPQWLQRQAKYGALSLEELQGAVERAVRRAEPFQDDAERPELLEFLRDVKEEYFTALAHVIDARFYRGGPAPHAAAQRKGYVVSMGQDMGCIKISSWTHLIPEYFDFENFWVAYPGARERGGVMQLLRGEEAWTTALRAHVWGMHHRYPTNSPAIDAEGRGNPAGAHPFKAYNVLLMHNGEQVGVDATAAMLEEHGHVHLDESMGAEATDGAGGSLYERKAFTDTEYAAYLVDFTRRVLGLGTEEASQIISPLTGIDLEAVTPAERRQRNQQLSRNYVHLTPTGPYKFTILESRCDAEGLRVGCRENMDIKFLRPHEIVLNWEDGGAGLRVVANGSEAKIADAMLSVLRQKGQLADAGADKRFAMRPGGRPGTGEMAGVFEAFLHTESGDLALRNRFGEAVVVERRGQKPEALRSLASAVAGSEKKWRDAAEEQLRLLWENPRPLEARRHYVDWVLENLRDWSFDTYRHVVEWDLPGLARHSDEHREAALWILTELRKQVHLADSGGKSLSALQYFVDGGFEYDGEPEGGIYRLLHEVPGLHASDGEAAWSRIGFDTRMDLHPPEKASQLLVVDLGGFQSEAFGTEGAARFLSRAVHLGWKRLVTYNARGGPRYVGTNLVLPAAGTKVRLDHYGPPLGDFLGALLEGADIRCYGQAQSHVGMKADRGSLFVLQDILNTGLYTAHGGTLSVWDSGSRFAVAGQNRVHEDDGGTPAPGLQSIHFGSPNEYAFEYLMSGGDNSLHLVMGLEKPDSRGQLQLRPRPYAGKFFMAGAAAGRVFVFDPERRMQPEQYHGNGASPPSTEEWRRDVAPFLAAQAAERGLPLRVTPEGLTLRIGAEWREYSFDRAFIRFAPLRISRAAQRQGETPPALVGMLDEA